MRAGDRTETDSKGPPATPDLALRSTRRGDVPPILGIDVPDLTVARPKQVDVCGLTPRPSGGFAAELWTWVPAAGGAPGTDPFLELRRARCVALDAPQGLAAPGGSCREAERLVRAPGRTPDLPSRVAGPYRGFVLTSLALFDAIARLDLPVSPAALGPGLWEVFPGGLWRDTGAGLARKTSAPGREQRRRVLEELGVALPDRPLTHDALDAAVAAFAAATALSPSADARARAVGPPLRRRPSGELEEGPILTLELSPALRRRLADRAGARPRRARAAPSRPPAGPRTFPCPIQGCPHVFRGTRGGWDAHVGALRSHPGWHPELRGPEVRKARFREEFARFFGP